MESKFHIAKADISQLNELGRLFASYREFYTGVYQLEVSKKFLAQRFVKNESIIFVASDQADSNNLAGFTQLYPSYSSVSAKPTLVLNDLFVEPQFRRQGIALALMNAAKSYAELAGANGLSLCTQVGNVSAQKLYEHLGYKKDEGFFHYFLSVSN